MALRGQPAGIEPPLSGASPYPKRKKGCRVGGTTALGYGCQPLLGVTGTEPTASTQLGQGRVVPRTPTLDAMWLLFQSVIMVAVGCTGIYYEWTPNRVALGVVMVGAAWCRPNFSPEF